MSVISGISRVRTHKAHSFFCIKPTNPNDTITRGFTLDLFSSNEKKVGNVLINGYENYIGENCIQQTTLSFFLDNWSLNFIVNFNTIKDALGKTTYPNRIVTRDQNGRNLLVIIKEKEREEPKDVTDPLKIEITIQHI
jgi:hypothetical protein